MQTEGVSDVVTLHETAPGAERHEVAGRRTMIEVQGLHVELNDVKILDNVDLAVQAGEILSVVGPSGCGKTTLLRALAGLVRPARGSVVVGGRKVTQPRRDIAVIFQDYGKALLPWRTAEGNVSLVLETKGTPRAERRDRIHELLSLVGLAGHGQKFPRQMSGGMQQRLQIARALAQEPSVMLMDEPFGALDAITRQTLQDETLAIAERSGNTICFVTHDLEEAIYVGDQVIGLLAHPGRVARQVMVDLPRPRHQISTREMPEFLRMRRSLFEFIVEAESK